MSFDDSWNSVSIYGPQSEIERFKRMCIKAPLPDDLKEGPCITFENVIACARAADRRLAIDLARSAGSDPWNLSELEPRQSGVYEFLFDTRFRFPIAIFRYLASLFPTLAFDCEAIAGDDSSMGYGWFNTPFGGEDFHDDYEVPEHYWAAMTRKRVSLEDEMRHQLLLAELSGWQE